MKQSFTILSEKLLDRILETNNTKLRSKSVPTPSAQSSKMLLSRAQADPIGLVSGHVLERIKNQNHQLYYLIEFMKASACRVTEALSIKPNDITSTGHVKINALKGSKSRIIHPGLSVTFILDCKSKSVQPWQGWSRFYVYREFKKFGINLTVAGKTNSKVTHAFRHTLAQSIKKANMGMSIAKDALGHKSIRSTKHYFNDEK